MEERVVSSNEGIVRRLEGDTGDEGVGGVKVSLEEEEDGRSGDRLRPERLDGRSETPAVADVSLKEAVDGRSGDSIDPERLEGRPGSPNSPTLFLCSH